MSRPTTVYGRIIHRIGLGYRRNVQVANCLEGIVRGRNVHDCRGETSKWRNVHKSS